MLTVIKTRLAKLRSASVLKIIGLTFAQPKRRFCIPANEANSYGVIKILAKKL
jgi:hypothetical protein